MITVIGGGFAGLSAAYFLHRAGKDVTLLEWSRGLGGRASTRNVGYRTVDSGAQRLDLGPLSSNPRETDARALLKAVADERGVTPHLMQFPGPVLRFDGRSIATSEHVDVPNWTYLDGGMKVFAEALAKDITVRTHTRISDIIVEDGQHKLRNQRGETIETEAIVVALPAPYALALLLPHADSNKKIKAVCDKLNEVHYEPMVGAIFGTTKINFKEHFTALFTDDVTAPVFWLSQEAERRKLGVRKNENAFVLQLGAEISREYVLKTDKETFAAIERVFEEVLDVPLPDVVYGEIQRWPTAFLVSSPFEAKDAEVKAFDVPLFLAGDYVAGQSSIASAFWSGKSIADKLLGVDASQFIAAPAHEQAHLEESEWGAVIPPARKPRKPRPAPKKKRAGMEGKKFEGRGPRPGGRPGGRPSGPGRPGGRPGGFQRGPRPDGGRGPQQRPWGARPQGPGGPRRPAGEFQGRGEGGYQQRGPRPQGGPGGGYQQRGPRPGGGGGYDRGPREGGYQGGGGGGFNRGPREGGYQGGGGGFNRGPREGGYQGGGGFNRGPREGGYQQGGGGYNRGPREGGYQQGGGGGYNRGPREGGYQGGGGGFNRGPREGGYQQGGGGYNRGPREGGYQQGGGGGYNRGPREGGYQQGGGGGYNRGPREGGYQGGGGGYQGGGGRGEQGGGYNRGPREGGGGGWQDRGNRPQRPQRDYNQQQPPDSSGGQGRKPVRGQVVYSTGNRPTPGPGAPQQPPHFEDKPRPKRPRSDEDENIGNR